MVFYHTSLAVPLAECTQATNPYIKLHFSLHWQDWQEQPFPFRYALRFGRITRHSCVEAG